MKRKLFRRACWVLFAFSVSACSTSDLGHTMRSWQGSHFDEVTAAWGQPNFCETIQGRRICAWHDTIGGPSLSATRTCVRSLEIDPDGIVIGWRWRGDYCGMTADRVLARAEYKRPDALAAQSPDTDDVGVAVTRPEE
jgi:hypothetical protein